MSIAASILLGLATLNSLLTYNEATLNCLLTYNEATLNCLLTYNEATLNCLLTYNEAAPNNLLTYNEAAPNNLLTYNEAAPNNLLTYNEATLNCLRTYNEAAPNNLRTCNGTTSESVCMWFDSKRMQVQSYTVITHSNTAGAARPQSALLRFSRPAAMRALRARWPLTSLRFAPAAVSPCGAHCCWGGRPAGAHRPR